MSADGKIRTWTTEVSWAGNRDAVVWAGTHPLHHYWFLIAPYFQDVLLPPQRRMEGESVAWTWRAVGEARGVTPAEASSVRRRLESGLESLEESAGDGRAGVVAAMKEVVRRLAQMDEAGLGAALARTPMGLRVHSWSAAGSLTPFAASEGKTDARGESPAAEGTGGGGEDAVRAGAGRKRRRGVGVMIFAVAAMAVVASVVLFAWRSRSPRGATPVAPTGDEEVNAPKAASEAHASSIPGGVEEPGVSIAAAEAPNSGIASSSLPRAEGRALDPAGSSDSSAQAAQEVQAGRTVNAHPSYPVQRTDLAERGDAGQSLANLGGGDRVMGGVPQRVGAMRSTSSTAGDDPAGAVQAHDGEAPSAASSGAGVGEEEVVGRRAQTGTTLEEGAKRVAGRDAGLPPEDKLLPGKDASLPPQERTGPGEEPEPAAKRGGAVTSPAPQHSRSDRDASPHTDTASMAPPPSDPAATATVGIASGSTSPPAHHKASANPTLRLPAAKRAAPPRVAASPDRAEEPVASLNAPIDETPLKRLPLSSYSHLPTTNGAAEAPRPQLRIARWSARLLVDPILPTVPVAGNSASPLRLEALRAHALATAQAQLPAAFRAPHVDVTLDTASAAIRIIVRLDADSAAHHFTWVQASGDALPASWTPSLSPTAATLLIPCLTTPITVALFDADTGWALQAPLRPSI